MNTKAGILLPLCLGLLTTWGAIMPALADEVTNKPDPAYVKVTQERAAKIVAGLGLTDTNKAERVRDIIAQQYQELSRIHEARDAQIKQLQAHSGTDKAASEAKVKQLKDDTQAKLTVVHKAYLTRLSDELTAEQVEKVKDGMTYGVVPLTYGVYLKMYPELTVEQKAQLKAWLVEAREIAMDGSTSDEKHAVFGKYKGRINNYLVKEGYDLKKGGENLKQASAPASGAKSE
jgi:Spy/CpxP family protein refolding chaperone